MLSDYFSQVFDNEVAFLFIAFLFASYVVIVAFYSGSWWLINLRLNSNTKKAKKLLRGALYIGGIALLGLIFIAPFFNEEERTQVQNPYLGDWQVITSSRSGIEEGLFLKIYVGSSNTIIGDFSEFDGKTIAYLRDVDLNHHDYTSMSGRFSSEFGAKNYFEARLTEASIIIDILTKTDHSIAGTLVLNKK